MSSKGEMIEEGVFSGKTVDDALDAARDHYGIPRSEIQYEVIDKGSTGFLGIINTKPAKIKVTIPKDEDVVEAAKPEKKEAPKEVKSEKKEAPKSNTGKPAKKAEEPQKAENKAEANEEKKVVSEEPAEVKAAPKNVEELKAEVVNFLSSILKIMEVESEIDVVYNDADRSLEVNVSGPNMGVLIGKRGQTLDALQRLTQSVVNKHSEEFIRVKLDTENYRARRKDTLENLARNISFKVRKSRKSVVLEPMNPYERRIIHSALQDDKYVSTRSEGEEPFRRVVIYYNRNKQDNK